MRTTVASADIGAHLAQLLQLGLRLLAGLLGELGLLDALLELGSLVAAVLAVAELLLDRLHLLVEIVLALRLLHLALDARADALLDLQDGDLASIKPSTFSSRSTTDEQSPASPASRGS